MAATIYITFIYCMTRPVWSDIAMIVLCDTLDGHTLVFPIW